MTTGLAAGVVNSMLDSLCRAAAWTPPAGFFVKLHTGDPGAAGASNAAGNTTRVAATMAAASGGANTNSADVVWSAVGTAETYTHVSFWSASSAGTFLGSDDLNASQAVQVGDNYKIPAGSLTFAGAPVAA